MVCQIRSLCEVEKKHEKKNSYSANYWNSWVYANSVDQDQTALVRAPEDVV